MVSKEDFLEWFERESNRRKQAKIAKIKRKALIDKDNLDALYRRGKDTHVKNWRHRGKKDY